MRITPFMICAALAAALSADTAFAGLTIDSVEQIIFIDDIGASVLKNGVAGILNDSVTASAGSGNSFASGEATQDSTLLPLVWSGSGKATLESHSGTPGGAHPESYLEVDFTITSTYQWATTGSVSQSTDGGTGSALARLTHSLGSDVFISVAEGNSTFTDFTNSGIIEPGQYLFRASAWAENQRGGGDPITDTQITASFDNVSLTLTPVIPEPASLSLLAIGAASLMLRRQRRTKFN